MEMVCDRTLIYLIFIAVLSFYINLYVNLLNKFCKQELKLEMFVTVRLSYSEWCILIVKVSFRWLTPPW